MTTAKRSTDEDERRRALSHAGHLLGSQPKRKVHERTCPTCGTTFQGRADQRFCSNICRARDQTRRKTEARHREKAGSD